MADRNKVIKGLESHLVYDISCAGCTYDNDGWCTSKLMADALKVLKDQPDIVRCKDCKFMYEDDCFQCGIKTGYFPVHEDWFCADGERKET